MGKQAVRKLSTALKEARSSGFWQRAQGYLEEKRPLSWMPLGQAESVAEERDCQESG